MLRLALIGGDALIAEAEKLGRSVRIAASAADLEALEGDAVNSVDALIVDGGMEDALEIGAEAAGRFPNVPVLLASEDTGIDLYRRASKKGLSGVLRRPLDREEIEEVLEEFGGDEDEPEIDEAPLPRGRKRRNDWEEADDDDCEEEDYSDRRKSRRRNRVVRQQVITVYSPKGGVGKTTLVCNLAAAYAKHVPDLRIAVLDFDCHARVTSLLQMKTSVSIENWQDTADERFETRLAVYPVGRQGAIFVLPGIRRPINRDMLDEALVTDVLKYMRQHADLVLVDYGPDFEDATVLSLEAATSVLIVATMDVQTLRDIYRLPKDVSLTHTDEKRIRTVLNRVPKKAPFSIRQVREWLPWELIAQVPEDESVSALQNHGKLPVLEKNCAFSSAVTNLAARLTPALEEAVQPHRGGLLARLFRRKGGTE